jgi:hypothetical protein
MAVIVDIQVQKDAIGDTCGSSGIFAEITSHALLSFRLPVDRILKEHGSCKNSYYLTTPWSCAESMRSLDMNCSIGSMKVSGCLLRDI